MPQAGSAMVLSGSGRTHWTIARISARGVKYCPAPDLVSSALRSKNQIGELLQVIAITHPIIAQRGAKAPDFGNDAGRVHGGLSFILDLQAFAEQLFQADGY
ncbi:MAG: hypothetical protein L0H73_06360 [Nitrococcus sp.]|nr:hypothetical protein [Nitrococcus sp.]